MSAFHHGVRTVTPFHDRSRSSRLVKVALWVVGVAVLLVICHAAGFEPEVSFESDDYQTVQGLVAAGVGVALIPQLAFSTVREDIHVRALDPGSPVRTVFAATPRAAAALPRI